MQLVSYRQQDQMRCGVIIDGMGIDLQRAAKLFCKAEKSPKHLLMDELPVTMLDLLHGGGDALQIAMNCIALIQPEMASKADALRIQGILFDLQEVELLAPVLCPGKIICVGGNYPASASNPSGPEYPILFLKPSSSVIGPGCPIKIPKIAQNVTYEVELAVVIGETVRNVSVADAFSYVAGYTIANDLGDRLLEKRTSQWTSGKMLDTFTPLGPVLVTGDEIPDPDRLSVQTRVNDVVVQQSTTAAMFFNVAYLISYISSLTTLQPGDTILTGSPKMIGDELAPNIFLRPGDQVEVEIEGLGILTNPVVSGE